MRIEPPADLRRPTPAYRLFKGLAWVLAKGLWRARVEGLEHIPQTGGVLIAASHPTYLDPPLVGAVLPGATSFVAKEELFALPLVRPFLEVARAIPVEIGASDFSAIRRGVQWLRHGGALVIFPEAGRSDHGRLRPGEPGVALLALLARVPVVPVALVGAYTAWPMDRPWPLPYPITVRFGPPLSFDQVTQRWPDRETLERVTAEIMHQIGRLLDRSAGNQAIQ